MQRLLDLDLDLKPYGVAQKDSSRFSKTKLCIQIRTVLQHETTFTCGGDRAQ